jgi:predicted ester cyclase
MADVHVENSRLEADRRVVAGLLAALNNHRLDELTDFLAPGVIDHNKIIFGESDAPGSAVDGFRQQLEAFPDITLSLQEMIAEHGTVAARLIVSGSHTGHHPRMPVPTNRHFSVEQIWIFTVVDDRITEIRAVSDRLGVFLQLGWDWPTSD